MKKIVKVILIIFLVFIILSGVGLISLSYYIKSQASDVSTICSLKKGTEAKDVIRKIKELKFDPKPTGALGSGFIYHKNSPLFDGKPWQDSFLPDLNNGRIIVGKVSLPPFLRHYCEILFIDKKIFSTREWTLD